jgi:hypothetical protein
MALFDYTNEELIRELQDRGFMVLTQEEAVEAVEANASCEILENLVFAIRAALEVENHDLITKLLEALIFCATGEETTIEYADELEAA